MSQSAPTDIDIGRFYTPQPVQRKFHASEARYPLLEGGRGGGKSTALLWEAISQCLLVSGANCLLLDLAGRVLGDRWVQLRAIGQTC